MSTATFDTLTTAREQPATKADLGELRAGLYRALWIQGGAIVAILTALRFLSDSVAGTAPAGRICRAIP